MRLRLHADDELRSLLQKHFPSAKAATSAELQQQIDRYAAVILAAEGDPYAGKVLFTTACAKCHTLFGQGAQVGPDLTAYQRDDLATMLLSVVNPSAEIREGYENHLLLTSDGLSLTGYVVDQDANVVMLRSPEGQTHTLARKDIEAMQILRPSIMPDSLLNPLSDDQVRDLFAYLRSTQPLND